MFFFFFGRGSASQRGATTALVTHVSCAMRVLMVFRCLFSAVCWGCCNSQVTSMIVASPGDPQPPGHSHSHDELVLVRAFVDVHIIQPVHCLLRTLASLSPCSLYFFFFSPSTSMLLFLITVHSQSYRPHHYLIKVLGLLRAFRAKKKKKIIKNTSQRTLNATCRY